MSVPTAGAAPVAAAGQEAVVQYMVDHSRLDDEQAEQVRRYIADHACTAGKAATDLGFLTRDDAKLCHAGATGVPVVHDLAAERTDTHAVALIPRAKARRWGVVPLRFEADRLVMAASLETASRAEGHTELADDLRLHLNGRAYRIVVASGGEVLAKLEALYRNEVEISELAAQVVAEGADTSDTVVRMVDLILEQAITDGASDIHVEPTATEVRVRYRIDGVLIEKPSVPGSMKGALTSRLKVMAGMDIAEQRRPQDGRLTQARDGRRIEMRVSSLPVKQGEKVVLRILDNSNTTRSLRDFAFSRSNEERWHSAAAKPWGMLLVTGPTGSGKSTTLYATLNELNKPGVNIVTVEDPVEYEIPGINQVQVNHKSGLDFARALRSILRQDPDIILLGEIRDRETAQIAIEAALTGHLVLSTLHTNDAPSAATRLTEMGIEGVLVGSVLECVLAQRLVRRLCLHCRQPVEPDPEELAKIGFTVPDGTTPTFFTPRGCPRCAHTGYRGRLAVHETMIRTPALEKQIVTDARTDLVQAQALADGLTPMKHDGWAKVAAGHTTIAEILRVVS